jgi:hypothetical protein
MSYVAVVFSKTISYMKEKHESHTRIRLLWCIECPQCCIGTRSLHIEWGFCAHSQNGFIEVVRRLFSI